MPRAKRKSPRQPALPETMPDRDNTHLDDLVVEPYDATRAWQALKPPMMEAKQRLHDAMNKAGVKIHETEDGYVGKIKTPEESVTIKGPKGAKPQGDDTDED